MENGLSDTADTAWMNRWLGGLKTAGTTFGWSAGDQRVDIQLAPSSEQFSGSHGATHLHHHAGEVSVPSTNVLMTLN